MFKDKLKELIDNYVTKVEGLNKPNLCTDSIVISKIEVDEAKEELYTLIDKGMLGHYDRFNMPESWNFSHTQFSHIFMFTCKESNTYFYDFVCEDENFSGFQYKDLESCKKDFEIFCEGL